MRIGELRKQITLQTETPTSDEGGGYALAWMDIATVWAAIEPISGNEVYTAQHLEGHVTHQVTLRYRDDVTTAMRMITNNRVFNIRSVLNIGERNQWLELLVEEGGAI